MTAAAILKKTNICVVSGLQNPSFCISVNITYFVKHFAYLESCRRAGGCRKKKLRIEKVVAATLIFVFFRQLSRDSSIQNSEKYILFILIRQRACINLEAKTSNFVASGRVNCLEMMTALNNKWEHQCPLSYHNPAFLFSRSGDAFFP